MHQLETGKKIFMSVSMNLCAFFPTHILVSVFVWDAVTHPEVFDEVCPAWKNKIK